MNDNIYSTWESQAKHAITLRVIPDGCRDIIMKADKGRAPLWFISPLFNHSKDIAIQGDSYSLGLRLKPGVEIDENSLLRHLNCNYSHSDDISHYLEDFTQLNHSVEEALTCLASEVTSIKQVTSTLGVSPRSLQRLLTTKTGRSPSYWSQLARVRKSARSLTGSLSFADTADLYGYSDQSHMCREIRRWFNATPTELITCISTQEQLNDGGYG